MTRCRSLLGLSRAALFFFAVVLLVVAGVLVFGASGDDSDSNHALNEKQLQKGAPQSSDDRSASHELRASLKPHGIVVRVYGRCVDEAGHALGDCRVVLKLNTGETLGSLETDQSGGFWAQYGMPMGESVLVFVTSATRRGTSRRSLEAQSANLDFGDIVVGQTAFLSGMVTDETGTPVGGLRVLVITDPEGIFDKAQFYKSTTSSSGEFRIEEELRPGKYRFAVSGHSYVLDGSHRFAISGQSRHHRLVVRVRARPEQAALTGIVVDEEGKGVEGVSLISNDKDSSGYAVVAAARTNKEGNFRMRILGDVDELYSLTVSPPERSNLSTQRLQSCFKCGAYLRVTVRSKEFVDVAVVAADSGVAVERFGFETHPPHRLGGKVEMRTHKGGRLRWAREGKVEQIVVVVPENRDYAVTEARIGATAHQAVVTLSRAKTVDIAVVGAKSDKPVAVSLVEAGSLDLTRKSARLVHIYDLQTRNFFRGTRIGVVTDSVMTKEGVAKLRCSSGQARPWILVGPWSNPLAVVRWDDVFSSGADSGEVQVAPSTELVGTLQKDAVFGWPWDGYRVVLRYQAPTAWAGEQVASIPVDGNFRLGRLTTGSVDVLLRCSSNREPQQTDFTIFSGLSVSTRDRPLRLDIGRAQLFQFIRNVKILVDGQAFSYGQCDVVDEEGRAVIKGVRCDAEGALRLALPNSTYHVVAWVKSNPIVGDLVRLGMGVGHGVSKHFRRSARFRLLFPEETSFVGLRHCRVSAHGQTIDVVTDSKGFFALPHMPSNEVHVRVLFNWRRDAKMLELSKLKPEYVEYVRQGAGDWIDAGVHLGPFEAKDTAAEFEIDLQGRLLGQ